MNVLLILTYSSTSALKAKDQATFEKGGHSIRRTCKVFRAYSILYPPEGAQAEDKGTLGNIFKLTFISTLLAIQL